MTETTTAPETTDPAAELAAFRQRVRRLAIRVADEEGWCNAGLNEALAELGLAPYSAGRFVGTAIVSGRIAAPLDPRLPGLTAENVLVDYVAVASGDPDVAITAQRLAVFTPDGDGGAAISIEVDVTVGGTGSERTARHWVRSALGLDWVRHPLRVRVEGVTEVAFTEHLTDPDAPEAY